MSNELTKEQSIIANAVLTFFGLPLIWIIQGMGLTLMWKWFVVPLGVSPISTAHALGITILLGYLRPIETTGIDALPEEMRGTAILLSAVVKLAVGIGMGWLVCQFM